ncbi:MAG TPA: purine-nucleoside phosphorylase [Pirellulaceae bacterium]|nr:purine-nucleoside phosphorylase [Pirellulaceae bacterium]HMO93705.1 purine-nucleoside phosphorylase [Pirellulaceae bacterium]HMP70967.1 purine-nucleoside phosphorylase [Pirellulaceae bacterium]
MRDIERKITEASQYIRQRWPHLTQVGIVLGTGSGQIADAISNAKQIAYASIPHFPQSTAIGHKGSLVCGELAGVRVIAMQGRFHLYEGYSFDQVTLPIHVLVNMGIRRLLISNAAGGVNPDFRKGEIMLIKSHLDFMWKTDQSLFRAQPTPKPMRGWSRADSALDPALLDLAEGVARSKNFRLHRGVYAGVLGPNYETRAEYRMFGFIGADAVGMSTIPELSVAAYYGLKSLACSIITNEAVPDNLEKTSGQEVVKAGEDASGNLHQIFLAAASAAF